MSIDKHSAFNEFTAVLQGIPMTNEQRLTIARAAIDLVTDSISKAINTSPVKVASWAGTSHLNKKVKHREEEKTQGK